MINVLLSGVGGQGTVLAAKILAQCAQSRGWQVRTAETIGMAQRGGSVVSHVRMAECAPGEGLPGDGTQSGREPETLESPLLPKASADLIIAFEPTEAARVLPYLAPDGVLVSAKAEVPAVTAALAKAASAKGEGDAGSSSGGPCSTVEVLASLESMLGERFVAVDATEAMDELASTRVLNTVLLATAFKTGALPFELDDLREAIRVCVKARFVDLNLAAVDYIAASEL